MEVHNYLKEKCDSEEEEPLQEEVETDNSYSWSAEGQNVVNIIDTLTPTKTARTQKTCELTQLP